MTLPELPPLLPPPLEAEVGAGGAYEVGTGSAEGAGVVDEAGAGAGLALDGPL